MLDFNTAVSLFKDDKIHELSATDEGMRFLKLRSLSRKEHLDYLINKFKIDIGHSKTNNEKFRIIYESDLRLVNIDDSIKNCLKKNEKPGVKTNNN